MPLYRIPSALLLVVLWATSVHATPADDPAWRNFQHALGQVPLIGANADHPRANSPYRPIPRREPDTIDRQRFELGSDLFHDARLSSDNSVACVTCHAGALSGADRRRVSVGVDGARGRFNALSVFNAGFNFRQFWDGRVVTMEDQALEPIQDEREMANTLNAALEMLLNDPDYPAQFQAAYPDGVTVLNMADAMAHFQRVRFVRWNTPFQRHLSGDDDAMGEQARRGWERFEALGCVSCHNGINLGGNSYQKLGAMSPYYGAEREAGPDDVGVAERSGRDRDRHVFRVPALHGVATTPPYLHDGSISTLEAAIEVMGEHQLGRQLSQQDIDDLSAFLRALGGSLAERHRVELPEPSDGAEPAVDDPEAVHESAYAQAIVAVEQAYEQLLQAMQQIHDSEVEHFDFLQAAHLELIRHARALHHPPSSLDRHQQGMLVSAAQELLDAMNELEWPISDFLRAIAMSRVLDAHQQESGGQISSGIDSSISEQQMQREVAMQRISQVDLDEPLSRIRDTYPHSPGD